MTKPLICFSLIFALFATLSVVESTFLGGWKLIKDVTDPNVVEIAKFAISEHNKPLKTNLVYDKVVEGKEQVVAGKKYSLIIAVKNDGKKYEAVVWDKPWENFRKLESFNFWIFVNQPGF